MAAPHPRRPSRHRGLTLIEAMVALALLVVLASVALPTIHQQMARQRLKATAETLAADLAELRFEAARQGRPLHLAFQAGPSWCYAAATTPGCGCQNLQPCQLKRVKGADAPGIELMQSSHADFDATGQTAGGTAALLRTRQGEQLAVLLSPMGRARICAPAGEVGSYPRC